MQTGQEIMIHVDLPPALYSTLAAALLASLLNANQLLLYQVVKRST